MENITNEAKKRFDEDTTPIQDLINSTNRQKIVDLEGLEGTKAEKLLKEKYQERYGVDLKECIEQSQRFVAGEMTEEEFNELGVRMKIRAYLPIVEKMELIMRLMLTSELNADASSAEIVTTEMYRNKFFWVVMGAYGGVVLNEGDYQTFKNYDLLYPLFYPFIVQFCRDDMALFDNMLRDSMSLYALMGTVDALGKIDVHAIAESTKTTKEMVNSMKENAGLISDLRDIMVGNDHTTAQVVEQIKKIAVNEAKINKAKEKLEEDKKK